MDFSGIYGTDVSIFITINNKDYTGKAVTITKENCERVYGTLKNIIVSFKFVITVIFAYMSIWTTTGLNLRKWFLPAVLILSLASIIVSNIFI